MDPSPIIWCGRWASAEGEFCPLTTHLSLKPLGLKGKAAHILLPEPKYGALKAHAAQILYHSPRFGLVFLQGLVTLDRAEHSPTNQI